MLFEKVLADLKTELNGKVMPLFIPFDDFIQIAVTKPDNVFRNIFQLFADMINNYLGAGVDEYPDDPDSINYIKYDCYRLFVEGTDNPFFADRPFVNRLVNLAKSFREGSHRNKIYIFEGPVGSGKSTFLNNLLVKFEDYTKTRDGTAYEIVWRIDREKIKGYQSKNIFLEEKYNINIGNGDSEEISEIQKILSFSKTFEIHCPSHDNPILIIPKQYRKKFFDSIIDDQDLKNRLFNRKEYEWLFKEELCTICNSLCQTLLQKVGSLSEVLKMVYARKYQYNRRLGEGLSVYNPGDRLNKQPITDPVIQKVLNHLFSDSNAVKYVFSGLARTNNGIYAIMDIKSNNKNRLLNLHGIISDSVHKVEHIEERVNSIFMALMNPEDKDVIESIKSFGDRVWVIPIPYVLDYNTEVEIYHNKFGREIDEMFLPGVLKNFAKVVISSRLNVRSKNIEAWVKDTEKYRKYCDKNLLLLKMDIYTGIIPTWLSEDDRKSFVSKHRKKIISESEKEGHSGNSISGRKSIEFFNEFYTKYAKEGILIDMSKVHEFFSNKNKNQPYIPDGFLDSLVTLYDYNILQEIKEALYNYNREEISKDIMNYMFAINFEIGSKEKCSYTGVDVEVTEDFFNKIENRLIRGAKAASKVKYREYIQKEYTSKTLSYEIGVEGKDIKETNLYNLLLQKYQYSLKEDVLNPLIENDNYRNAIKDYDLPVFKTYDKKIRSDVKFFIKNLKRKYGYSENGAKQVSLYVIDNNIPKKFQ